MKKIGFYIILINLILSLIAFKPVLAFDSLSLLYHQTPYSTIHSGSFDNLVMDFSLITIRPDTIRAIALKNKGNADYLNQIKLMSFWVDKSDYGFQGLGIDQHLGDFSYSASCDCWYLQNLDYRIDTAQRFFVSVTAYSALQKPGTIQMELPQLIDHNQNQSFDVGDLGVFLDSGNNGLEDKYITNTNEQVFTTAAADQLAPKIVVSNLQQQQLINNDHYLINGLIKDQGDSELKEFKIKINSEEFNIIDIDPATSQWQYAWQGIEDGEYIVSFQASDKWDNLVATEELLISVKNQEIDLTNSQFSCNKAVIYNTGIDYATCIVEINDSESLPVADRQLEIIADPSLLLDDFNNNSDSSGRISFKLRSYDLGSQVLKIKIEDHFLGSQMINVKNQVMDKTNLNTGDLIKASSKAVYYFGADGKRYVFPQQQIFYSWYQDFSKLKLVSDQDLAQIPIGGNVTYKPGTILVKIQTEPKVYAIDRNSTLRWLASEEVAEEIFGPDWNKMVIDIPDSFFVDYSFGPAIDTACSYKLEQVLLVDSINDDKFL